MSNAVIDQYHDEATFRDMGSLPATVEAAAAADLLQVSHWSRN